MTAPRFIPLGPSVSSAASQRSCQLHRDQERPARIFYFFWSEIPSRIRTRTRCYPWGRGVKWLPRLRSAAALATQSGCISESKDRRRDIDGSIAVFLQASLRELNEIMVRRDNIHVIEDDLVGLHHLIIQ